MPHQTRLPSFLILVAILVAVAPAFGQAPPGSPPPPQRHGPPPPRYGQPPPPPRPLPPPREQLPPAPARSDTPVVLPRVEPVSPTAALEARVEAARRAGARAELGRALLALADQRTRLGRPAEALPPLEEAAGIANALPDDRLGREAALAAAEAYRALNDEGMARTWLDHAERYRRNIAVRFGPPPVAEATTPSITPVPPSPDAAREALPPAEPPPAPRWPWLLLALAAAAVWAWLDSRRRAERLHEETERLARHQRHLKSANSALQEQASQLRQAAVEDALTGALSRAAFARQLEEILAHAAHYGKPVALMVFDLDHFKAINDGHGHLAGDAALKFVAGVVRESLDSDDLFGRFGGDEFLIGCENLDRPQALALAEKIRLAVCQRAGRQRPEFTGLSLSLGIALAGPDGGYSMEALFSRADAALYAAKRAGRNRSELEERGSPAPPHDRHAPRSLAPGGA